MESYLKIIIVVLITIVLGLIISKQGRDYSAVLSIVAVVLVLIGAIAYLKPVITFVSKVSSVGKLNNELLHTLLKSVGIGLLAELVCLICIDSGQNALGKTVQVFSGAVILWLSIPIFTQLLELVENILGAL